MFGIRIELQLDIRACLKSSEQKDEKGNHRRFKGNVEFFLTVYPKAATFVKPTKCVFYNPMFGQYFELVKFIPLYHINCCTVDFSYCMGKLLTRTHHKR